MNKLFLKEDRGLVVAIATGNCTGITARETS